MGEIKEFDLSTHEKYHEWADLAIAKSGASVLFKNGNVAWVEETFEYFQKILDKTMDTCPAFLLVGIVTSSPAAVGGTMKAYVADPPLRRIIRVSEISGVTPASDPHDFI